MLGKIELSALILAAYITSLSSENFGEKYIPQAIKTITSVKISIAVIFLIFPNIFLPFNN